MCGHVESRGGSVRDGWSGVAEVFDVSSGLGWVSKE